MKTFDLERAKAGDPVETRTGITIKLVCFEVPGNYPIIGYDCSGGVHSFCATGKYHLNHLNIDHDMDLFMATKKVQHWVNVYRIVRTWDINVGRHRWPSEAKAIENIDDSEDRTYIKTILLHEVEI